MMANNKSQTRNILRAVLNRAPIAGIPRTNQGAVNSSAIAGLGYNENIARLMVTFTTGRTYAYYGVSPDTYRAFRNADSKGRFFNANIRNYPYERMG